MKLFYFILFSILFMTMRNISLAKSNQNRIQKELELGGFCGSEGLNCVANAKVGYLFNDKIFLGGGVGVGVAIHSRKGDPYSFVKVPLFLSAKYYFHLTNSTAIVAAVDGGYNVFFKQDDDLKFTFVTPKAGFVFKLGEQKSKSINIYAGYDVGVPMDQSGIIGLFISFNF